MALHLPKVSSLLEEIDGDVEFATDMEEPVYEGREDDDHQQERHTHGITDVFFVFLKISTRDCCRQNNSLNLFLDIISNTEQLWRNF